MIENKYFKEIYGNFGFGMMRLPVGENDSDINIEESCRLVDEYVAAGFNYFDVAHGYHEGACEEAFRKCVAERYDRSEYILTDKLTDSYFETAEDVMPLFQSQLEACGVDYFDFYLLHSLNDKLIDKYENCNTYGICAKLKEQGLIKHLGISFHDKASVLERILTAHPEIEVVQIQLNYADYEDEVVESRKVYEVCERFDKPVIVMEPVKGGNLAGNLPEEARAILAKACAGPDENEAASEMAAVGENNAADESAGPGEKSPASYAIRFAAGFPNVYMVLSGMSTLEQVRDNTSFMQNYEPLTDLELKAVWEAADVFNSKKSIPCTGCKYCVQGCPMDIQIPGAFAAYNKKIIFDSWNEDYYYKTTVIRGHGSPADCIGCGACEDICPQHLEIRKLLAEVAEKFGK